MKTTGLSLQEAIKSGRPFKRSVDKEFLEPGYDGYIYNQAEVLATDWEIKREPMTIWVNVYESGSLSTFDSQEIAEYWARVQGGKTKKFVEVIE